MEFFNTIGPLRTVGMKDVKGSFEEPWCLPSTSTDCWRGWAWGPTFS